MSFDGDKKMIHQYLEIDTATAKTQLRILQDFTKVRVMHGARKFCHLRHFFFYSPFFVDEGERI